MKSQLCRGGPGELIKKKHLPYPSYKCDKFVKNWGASRAYEPGKKS